MTVMRSTTTVIHLDRLAEHGDAERLWEERKAFREQRARMVMRRLRYRGGKKYRAAIRMLSKEGLWLEFSHENRSILAALPWDQGRAIVKAAKLWGYL